MRLAYLTTDEVNQDLAIRIAADCGTTLALLSPRDPPPNGRFDAVLYDWDFWPLHLRREVLEELLTAHRLWSEWLREGRVRKLAVIAEKARSRSHGELRLD